MRNYHLLLSLSLSPSSLLPPPHIGDNWFVRRMTEKISTLILEVDLQCTICSKKIRKVLGKLQDRENIQSVVYDEQKSTVTVSGPFDPKKLSKKLCIKACKVIKSIKQPPPPPPPVEKPPPPPPPIEKPPPPPPPVEKPPPPPPPVEKPPPPPPPVEKPPPPPPTVPQKPPPPPPDKPPPPPSLPSPYPYPYPYPYPTVWPFIPVCGCHGWCTCKPATEPPPPPPAMPTCSTPCYDGCRTCKFIYEEEPSYCSIM